MNYKTTSACDQDMIEIYGRGVTGFGVDQAERYYQGLIATFDVLADNPRMARERSEFKPAVRLHPYQSHVIVYVEQGNSILIVRILHGRQDWERQMSQIFNG